MKRIYFSIAMVCGLLMAGCRTGKECERSSLIADTRLEYRSIDFESVLRLDSAFSKFDFEADSITIAMTPGYDSLRRNDRLNVTIHNPRAHCERTDITQTLTTAMVADTVAASATIDSSGERVSVNAGSGTKWGLIGGIIVGILLMGFIYRRLRSQP